MTTPLAIDNSQQSRRQLATVDALDGVRLWRVWCAFGWTEILQRYRRSILGPFWLTLSMAISVVALGTLYSYLFRMEVAELLPYVCVGLLIWSFISSILTEAGTIFTAYELFIKQIRLPYTLYVWRFLWSKTIVFLHNFLIYIAVLFWFQIWPGKTLLVAIPGLALLLLNGLLTSAYLGMLATRFRDVPQIVASATQVVFFVTPVLWKPELLSERRFVVDWNPFYHFIEIVRAPLLGQWPPAQSVVVTLVITAVNGLLVSFIFPRFRSRISYWL